MINPALISVEIVLLSAYGLLFLRYWKQSNLFSIYLLMFISHVGILVSLLLIDNFNFDVEIVIERKNSAFFLFYLFAVISMVFFYYLVQRHREWVIGLPRRFAALFYISALVLAIPLLVLRLKGAAIDRFEVYSLLPMPYAFSTLHAFVNGFFVFAILSAGSDRSRIAAGASMALLNYAVGAEFGAFLEIIVWFLIAKRIRGESISRAHYAAGIVLFVSAVIYKSMLLEAKDIAFLARVAMQGETFYEVLNVKLPSGFIDANALIAYVSNFFSLGTYNTTAEYGFGRLMYVLLGSDAHGYLEHNVRLTAGYPAIFVYHFNYAVALALNFMFILIYVEVFLRLLFVVLRRHGAIVFSFYYKLFLIFAAEFLAMGDYGQIRMKFLVYLLLLVVYVATIQSLRKPALAER